MNQIHTVKLSIILFEEKKKEGKVECGKKNKKKDGLLNSNLAVHEINFHKHE